MAKRISSKKTLKFVIPGRPLCSGSPANRRLRAPEEREKNGANSYRALVAMCAKCAVIEQEWEVVPDEPLYILLTINLGPGRVCRIVQQEKMWRGEILPTREPSVDRLVRVIMGALKDIVYTARRQVVGLLTVKRYTKNEQCVEVLVGRPSNWGELNHDLRNA